MRSWILELQDAKKYLSHEEENNLPSFLKKIGSNVVVTAKTVRYEAQNPWRLAANRAAFRKWLGRRDSNPRMPAPEAGALPLGYSPRRRRKIGTGVEASTPLPAVAPKGEGGATPQKK
jgi:hypothetical protein